MWPYLKIRSDTTFIAHWPILFHSLLCGCIDVSLKIAQLMKRKWLFCCLDKILLNNWIRFACDFIVARCYHEISNRVVSLVSVHLRSLKADKSVNSIIFSFKAFKLDGFLSISQLNYGGLLRYALRGYITGNSIPRWELKGANIPRLLNK